MSEKPDPDPQAIARELAERLPLSLDAMVTELAAALATAEARGAAQQAALVAKWRANADILSEGNKDEGYSEAAAMQRACADELADLPGEHVAVVESSSVSHPFNRVAPSGGDSGQLPEQLIVLAAYVLGGWRKPVETDTELLDAIREGCRLSPIAEVTIRPVGSLEAAPPEYGQDGSNGVAPSRADSGQLSCTLSDDCPVHSRKATLDRALAEAEALKDEPSTPVGPVVYTAHKAKDGRPSLVRAQWHDAVGRRYTQYVATCQSTLRDTDHDAEVIAQAFNALAPIPFAVGTNGEPSELTLPAHADTPSPDFTRGRAAQEATGCICPQDGSTCWTCAGTPSEYCKGHVEGRAAGLREAADEFENTIHDQWTQDEVAARLRALATEADQ